jgi:hypothetical protein
VLAARVRTEGYNAMLARAKRGIKFGDPKNNTWTLERSNEASANSALAKMGRSATDYLDRVVEEHPSTPWAFLAQRELEQPLGWEWSESHTPQEPRRNASRRNNNNRPMPRDDEALRLARPKPKREVPKL